MDDKEVQLSYAAEKAIRGYLFKVFLPAGTILGVVLFILGLLIKHGAENQAARDAFDAAKPQILESIRAASAAESDARRVAEALRNLQLEAERINDKLRTAEAFTKSNDLVVQIADNLSMRKDFLDRVSGVTAQIDIIRARIDTIQSVLQSAPHNPLPASGGNAQTGTCPNGAYMVGARMQSDSGGPHGIISNIIPVCKPLFP